MSSYNRPKEGLTMKLSRFVLVAMAALVLAPMAHAADTTPNNLSTEQEKIYLLPDGTWVRKTMNVDSTGADTQGTDGTAITPPTGGTGVRGWLSGIYQAITGSVKVQGPVAGAAASSGNPVPIGGDYLTTPPTYTTGQRTSWLFDSRGRGTISLCGIDSTVCVSSSAGSSHTSSPAGLITKSDMFAWDPIGAVNHVRLNSMAPSVDSTGVSILATGLLANFDDTSPNNVTENQFGNLRMSSDRFLGVAGYDGTNVRKLSVDTSGNQTVVGNVAGAATDSGNPVKIGGVYSSTLPTYTTGQRTDLQINSRGVLLAQLTNTAGSAVVMGAPADGNTLSTSIINVTSSGGFNGTTWDRIRTIQGAATVTTGIGVTAVAQAPAPYNHITTATTTTVKSGAGMLERIVINTLAASGTITIYDNTAGSGTAIAVITNPGTLLAQGPITADYNLGFGTGLTIVTTGVQDITVVYR